MNIDEFCTIEFGLNIMPRVYRKQAVLNVAQWNSRVKNFTIPINNTEGDMISIRSISAASGTVLSFEGITFTYEAAKYWNGKDRVDYTICDQWNECNSQWLFINITNEPPTCSLGIYFFHFYLFLFFLLFVYLF